MVSKQAVEKRKGAKRRSVYFWERTEMNTDSTKERSSTDYVSLRSQLEAEVMWGAVKGTDEPPLQDALDCSTRQSRRVMQMESN